MSEVISHLFSRARNINPGAWAIEWERPLSTLLGSCVAVCLYDPDVGVAGMNHFLLPSRCKQLNEPDDIILAGDAAMANLLNAMLGRGARKSRLIAKMFGGGTIVSNIRMAIGERNVMFAREWLAQENIHLAAADVLGNFSRKIVFDPLTGDAFCRRSVVNQSAALELAKKESEYAKTLTSRCARPNIELF